MSDEFSSEPKKNSLPGVGEYSDSLQEKFLKKLGQLDVSYTPRTRHLNKSGSAKFTNRLFLETSPYLLQHAHNPVNWYPWGDEAFKTAKKLNRPVLLSVGYSTCHWCHVMEEESFEDEEIASYLNSHYIAIKVDREERPDIDAIYMKAVQALTGHGGWPMTVWLSPDRKPFHGGTYFPARDGDRGQQVGFLTLVEKIEEVFHQDPKNVDDISQQVIAHIQQLETSDTSIPSIDLLQSVITLYQGRFDSEFGGLVSVPKFPSSLSIPLLLRFHHSHQDPESLEMATLTLDLMRSGGIYDQVGGGFHRYSTDRYWLVPHFEKMLYDNASLASIYLEAYQLTGSQDYAEVSRDILRYIGRDMTSPEGGFYSATDADSITPKGDREEGYYFTWTNDELDELLNKAEAEQIKEIYGVSDHGNFEGRNILNMPNTIEDVAKKFKITSEQLKETIMAAREKLYVARQKRPLPIRDEKIITAWNGMAISAFARAALILDEEQYANRAKDAANFVLEHLYKNGQLCRSYKDGEARNIGFLSDYAFFIAGLLDLYEATGSIKWLTKAIELEDVLEEYYEDSDNGGFFLTSAKQEKLLFRDKPTHDGAIPSANSIAILNLLRMSEFTSNAKYYERATEAIKGFSSSLKRDSASNTTLLSALHFYHDQPKQIVIVVAKRDRESLRQFMDVFRRLYLPNRVLVVVHEGEELNNVSKVIPLVRGKLAQQGKTTAYVCIQGNCDLPVTTPELFAKQLEST